ncbi:MAG: fibrinogen-like YCDxxxxGGGW domain-containing protein [Nannocystaceae bacterium]
MLMNSRLPLTVASAALLGLCLSGCLSAGPRPEGNETESGSTSDTSTGSTTTTTTTGSTTTTDTDTTTNATSSGVCGDGNVDAGEACDDGAANSDDAACTANCMNNVCGDGLVNDGVEECDDGNEVDEDSCTASCKNNVCGDGIVNEGVELCDDGVNDGAYNGCADNCMQLGPYCGDGVLDTKNEGCDDPDVHSGCLPELCTMATSCLEIKNAVAEAETAIYTITPAKGGVEPLQVWCEMEADGGGYTMLKANHYPSSNAAEAEVFCDTYGMTLFVPRTEAHLLGAFDFAVNENLAPVDFVEVTATDEYLVIMGVYPKVSGETCPGAALNSVDCDAFEANDGGPFWVSAAPYDGQPSTSNCAGCSGLYGFDESGIVNYMTFYSIKGGGDSETFLCHIGDK